MEENEKTVSTPDSFGLAKKKAINKAASYFSDDDSLFEFEGFEVELSEKPVPSVEKAPALSETADSSSESPESTPYVSSDREKGAEEKQELLDETEKSTDMSEKTSESYEETSNDGDTEKDEGSADEEKSYETEEITESISESEKITNTGFEKITDEGFENAEILSDGQNSDSNPSTEKTTSEAENTLDGRDAVKYDEEQKQFEKSEEAYGDYEQVRFESDSKETETAYDTEDALAIQKDEPSFDDGIEPTKPEAVPVKKARLENGISYNFDAQTISAEGQIHFEGTESEFTYDAEITEKFTEDAESNVSDNIPESTDELDNDTEEEEPDSEIWDKAGKEEWEARESFIDYCKSLTLPPVKTITYGNSEAENVKTKAKANSSGYRYAESERIPVFSDGMHGGSDKAGYAEREKRYCEQRKARRELMLREKTRSLHRTVLYTALILLTVFLLEILNSAIGGQSILFASIELSLIVLGAAFVWRALLDGIRCAVRGTFIPETLSFIVVLLYIVYTFITMLAPAEEGGIILIGIPAAVAIFLTAAYRSLMAEREKKVFDITADYGDYCTEVIMSSFKGSPEEIAFGGYADEDASLYKTNRIPRSDGGYNTQPVRDECFGLIKILLICLICAAVASGIAFGFISRDAYYGLFSAYILICLASPLSVFLSLAIPRHLTAEDIAEEGAAITDFDDESEELDKNVIMLSEAELFPPEKIKIIDTYWSNSHFLETHLSRAAAAFRKTGGLLSELFSSIDPGRGSYKEVYVTDISDNGITVKVDDSFVRAGDESYLENHGIEIERYHDLPQKDTRVLYIANNGEFFARIAIQYNPDERLCRKISDLRQHDTLFSLKTCNPSIDSSLVFYTTGLEPELLRVVKYMVEDDITETDSDREGSLVSRTGAVGLFAALLGYKRQKKLVKIGSKLAALSGLIGVTLALTVSLIGIKWKFISFAILGFHLIMSAVAVFIGASAKRRIGRKR